MIRQCHARSLHMNYQDSISCLIEFDINISKQPYAGIFQPQEPLTRPYPTSHYNPHEFKFQPLLLYKLTHCTSLNGPLSPWNPVIVPPTAFASP